MSSNYEFVPIVNGNLTSYDGKNGTINTHIYNLSTINTAEAGLFGKVSNELAITDCCVCWKNPEKLVKTDKTDYIYAVSGANAGGLVGSVSGTVNITNSFAATTVKGTASAGGLVSSVSDTGTVTVENSYADCYLCSGTDAGGLVGSVSDTGTVNLTNCYAAGFITGGTNTAGLVNGSETATSGSSVYSVVRVLKTKTEGGTTTTTLKKPGTPLYGNVGEPTTGSVRYLGKKEDVTDDVKTDLGIGSGGAFVAAPETTHVYNLRHKLSDEPKDKVDAPYIFPGLNGLPHYGDWAKLDQAAAGLAYYETYGTLDLDGKLLKDATGKAEVSGRGVYGPGLTDTLKKDTDNPTVIKDGYALVFLKEKAEAVGFPGAYSIKYGGKEWKLTKVDANIWEWGQSGTEPTQVTSFSIWKLNHDGDKWEWTWENPADGETDTTGTVESLTTGVYGKKDGEVDVEGGKPVIEATCTIIPLPDKVVTEGLADISIFYQKLDCGVSTYYFNPHFAKTVEMSNPGTPDPVYVRTPRHLYSLSRFQNKYKVDESKDWTLWEEIKEHFVYDKTC